MVLVAWWLRRSVLRVKWQGITWLHQIMCVKSMKYRDNIIKGCQERGAIKNTPLAHLTRQSAKLTVPFGWTTLGFVQDHNTYRIKSFHSTALKDLSFQSQTGKTKIIRKKQRLFNFQSTDQALDKLTAASEPTQLLQESMTVIPETLMKLLFFKPLSLLVPPPSSHKAKYKLKGTDSCAQFCSVHSKCW